MRTSSPRGNDSGSLQPRTDSGFGAPAASRCAASPSPLLSFPPLPLFSPLAAVKHRKWENPKVVWLARGARVWGSRAWPRGCVGKLARRRVLVGRRGEAADVASRLWMATLLLAWLRRVWRSFPPGETLMQTHRRALARRACQPAARPSHHVRALVRHGAVGCWEEKVRRRKG
jgi:hypothetical protein